MKELLTRYPALSACGADIEALIATLSAGFKAGGKLLLCGNGGSASDCEHIAGELLKSFVLPRRPEATLAAALADDEEGGYILSHLQQGLPTISLPSQIGVSTAFVNDVAADTVYAQLVYAYGTPNDVLWCLSTSGNSRNAVLAAKVAKARGMKVVALTGAKDSKLSAIADVTVKVPETETFKVQELHLPVYHTVCLTLEREFFSEV